MAHLIQGFKSHFSDAMKRHAIDRAIRSFHYEVLDKVILDILPTAPSKARIISGLPTRLKIFMR